MRRWLYGALVLAGIGGIGILWAEDAPSAGDQWTAPARAARKANPVPADEKSIAAGKVLYLQECRACHGDAGKGDGPSAATLEKKPGDLSSPKLWEQSDGALFWKITNGRKPMPTFEQKFTDEQRWAVVNYVRTLAPRPAGK